MDENLINKLLSSFIGEKLITLETQNLNIEVSEKSLSKIIKNHKIFKRDNKFSRTEYEKFLIKNSLDAVTFEANLLYQTKREHFFNFLGGGIIPTNFLVSNIYNKINQKRDIQLINLNIVFKKKMNFTANQIESYYNKNKSNYSVVYKSIRFVELTPKNLTNNNEFDDLFFKKIDDIDDLIIDGKNLNYIAEKFNLDSVFNLSFDKSGIKKNGEKINNFSNELIVKIFNINETEPSILLEHSDKYFIVELLNTENIQKDINDESVKKNILLNLRRSITRKSISEIISRINDNNFKKNDFYNLSKNENVNIQKVKLENRTDDKIIKKELLNQIYAYPEKKVIVVADIGFTENYLIYIDKIENVSINHNSKDYKKYFNLANVRMKNNLYNTYDSYLNKKYKININYNALDIIKNNLQ